MGWPSCCWVAVAATGMTTRRRCEALRDAQGDNTDIYDDLREMDLIDELRSALAELGQASGGEEISPEVFERGGHRDGPLRRAGCKSFGLGQRHGHGRSCTSAGAGSGSRRPKFTATPLPSGCGPSRP